jgi:hypothetical protein
VPAPEKWLDGTLASAPRRIFATSTFDASIAVASLAACEALLNPVAFGFSALPLAAALGAAIGSLLGFVYMLLLRQTRPRQILAWCAPSAALGLTPAIAIGSFAKLRGPHHGLALVTIVATALCGALVGAVLALGQPTRVGRPTVSRPAWLAFSVVVAFAAAFATEASYDTLPVLRVYPPLRIAMFAATCLLVAHAGIAAGAWLRSPRTLVVAPKLVIASFAALVVSGVIADASLPGERVGPLLSRPISRRLFLLARAITDFDGDGSSSLFGGDDCAPFDAAVNPRAREIPGNGIDDNCRWGDAKVKKARVPATVPAGAPPSPVDVVILTIDTLRADHVGSYGYARPTTPHLDEFARTALRFEDAYTSGGWTCLAMNSMLTGLYSRELDWQPVAITTNERIVPFPWKPELTEGEHWMNTLSAPVRTPIEPMPIWLRAHGIRSTAVVASMPGMMLDYKKSLEHTFDDVFVAPRNSDDSAVVDAALERLFAMKTDAPFFLWVHLFEPHEPYGHQPEAPTFGDTLVDRYDHDVAFSDYQAGRLLAAIDARKSRPTAIIVASDHGESFEGGVPAHGADLHEESIHIPLFVRGPGVTPGVSDAQVSLVDVASTVLEWTGTPGGDLDGVSLLHPLANRAVITDIWRNGDDGHLFLDLVGVTAGDRRLVRDLLNETWTMYAAHDMTRPLRGSGERVDEGLRAVIGSYLEETGVLE